MPLRLFSYHDLAERTVADSQRSGPGNSLYVQAALIAMEEMIVQEGGKKIVARSDRMGITGKMQIDLLHGKHLSTPASGAATLDSKYRTEGRLPERHSRALA
jgi:hypothetical protein